MEAWDEELIRTGVPVVEARGEAVARLATGASEEFEALAGYGLVVEYAPNVSFGETGGDVPGAAGVAAARRARPQDVARRAAPR